MPGQVIPGQIMQPPLVPGQALVPGQVMMPGQVVMMMRPLPNQVIQAPSGQPVMVQGYPYPMGVVRNVPMPNPQFSNATYPPQNQQIQVTPITSQTQSQ